MIPPFETTFAVPLSCESCIKDVSKSLYELEGTDHFRLFEDEAR